MPVREAPEGYLSPYPPGHADQKVEDITELLDSWFHALEQGTAHLRLPDPAYVRRKGKPSWTPEELATLVNAIDAKTDKELSWASKNKLMQCNAGPGFARLELPQRLALAQSLDSVLAQYDARPPEPPVPRVASDFFEQFGIYR